MGNVKEEIIKKIELILKDFLSKNNITIKPTKKSIAFYKGNNSYPLAYKKLVNFSEWLESTNNINLFTMLSKLVECGLSKKIFGNENPLYIKDKKTLKEIRQKFKDEFNKTFSIDYEDLKLQIKKLESLKVFTVYKKKLILKNNLYSKLFNDDFNIQYVYTDDIVAKNMFLKCIRKINNEDSDYYFTYDFIPLKIDETVIKNVNNTYFFVKQNLSKFQMLDDIYNEIFKINEYPYKSIKKLNENISEELFLSEKTKNIIKFELNQNIEIIFPNETIEIKELDCDTYQSLLDKIQSYSKTFEKNILDGYNNFLEKVSIIIKDTENLEILYLIKEEPKKGITTYRDILAGSKKEYRELKSYGTLKYLKKEEIELKIENLILQKYIIRNDYKAMWGGYYTGLIINKDIINLIKKEKNLIENISDWKYFYEIIKKDLLDIETIKTIEQLPIIDINNVIDTINFFKEKSIPKDMDKELVLNFIVSKMDESVIPILSLNYNIFNLEKKGDKKSIKTLLKMFSS